jgi:hypothetical protein
MELGGRFLTNFLLGGIVLGLALGGIELARGQDSQNTFYACVTPVNAAVFKLSNSPHTCPKNTYAIQWNAEGQKGDIGPTGAKGEPGSTGYVHLRSLTGVDGGTVMSVNSPKPSGFNSYSGNEVFDTVLMNGALWIVEPATGRYFTQSNVGYRNFFYPTPDCTGNPFLFTQNVFSQGDLPQPNGTITASYFGGQSFEVKATTKTLGDMVSIQTLSNGCQPLDWFYQYKWTSEYQYGHASEYGMWSVVPVAVPQTAGPLEISTTNSN